MANTIIDCLTVEIYQWLQEQANEAHSDRLTVESFRTAKKETKASRQEIQAAFKRAHSAFQFVTKAHRIEHERYQRRFNSEERMILKVFKRVVGWDSNRLDSGQIERLSLEQAQLESFRDSFVAFTSRLPEIVDVEVAKQEMANLQTVIELYKLKTDPYLERIPEDQREKYFKTQYPLIENMYSRFVTADCNRGEFFSRLSTAFSPDRALRILKGLFLLEYAESAGFETAAQWSSETLKTLSDNWGFLQKIFEGVSEADLEGILKPREEDVSGDIDLLKPLLIIADRLRDATLHYQIDEFTHSKLSPNQQAIWEIREKVVCRAEAAYQNYLRNLIQKGVPCNVDVDELVQEWIKSRDAEGVTDHFKTDGHRTGMFTVGEEGKKPTVFEERNTVDAEVCASRSRSILSELKTLATTNEEVDSNLYAVLQEMVCQEVEKTGAERALSDDIQRKFSLGVMSLMLVSFSKQCISLTKIQKDQFIVTFEYDLKMANPNTGQKTMDAIQLQYRIERGENRWKVSQPEWIYVSEQQPEERAHFIPPASLPVEAEEPAKIKEVTEGDSDEDDEKCFILPKN